MEQSPSWEPDSHSASQKNPAFCGTFSHFTRV